VEDFHLADHRFLPRMPSPRSGDGKTDYRSNFDKPTDGLSIEFDDGGTGGAHGQDRGPVRLAWAQRRAMGGAAAVQHTLARDGFSDGDARARA
jgi:hypothetical protein